MRNASNTVNGGFNYKRIGNGAGGWVTHIATADDGWMVCGCDTNAAYVRGPTGKSWKPLIQVGTTLTIAEMDSVIANGFTGPGNYGVDIAPTNSQYIYLAWGGWIWKSTDRGQSITRCSGWSYDSNMDVSNRLCGHKIRIDPAGTNIVAYGGMGGLYYTTNSGTTWTRNSSVPNPTSPTRMVIAFDRATISGGKSQTVYVYSGGNGVYKSTTGIDGTFSLVTGSASYTANTIVCFGGKLFMAGDGNGGDGNIKILSGSTWSDPGFTSSTVVVNPSNANQVWVFQGGGANFYSSDGGATFGGYNGNSTRSATDIPWLAWTNEYYMSNGDQVYNPVTNTIFFSQGIGVWEATPVTDGGNWAWQSRSLGIDQLVGMHVVTTPSGRIHTSSMDRPHFSFTYSNVGQQASTHGPSNAASISHGDQVDYAIDNDAFVVATHTPAGGLDSAIAYSTDNGTTWNIANNPATYYSGNIAVGNSTNWIYVPSNNGRPSYTLDGGTTWNYISLNATYDSVQGFHGAYWMAKQTVVADKSNPGTFYLHCYGDPNNPTGARHLAMVGIWKTTNGGVSWTRIYSSALSSNSGYDYWHTQLKAVPGNPTHLMFTAGPNSSDYDESTDMHILFSKTSGTSWTAIPGMNEPNSVGFGAPAPGRSYWTIYAYGWVGGVRGLYRMIDFDPTTVTGNWTLVDRYPLGRVNTVCSIDGDKNVFGRVYLSLKGEGFAYMDYADTAHAT